ncbi:MAG: AIM24 family protein, partial [Lachnospiraceae bacterium]|nr:AIM24 family protein [Lachnospiraceae bacterium]
MQYRIIGDTMPAVEVLFDAPGESMYTQSGGMAWMSDGIAMDSNMRGGLGKSIGRM